MLHTKPPQLPANKATTLLQPIHKSYSFTHTGRLFPVSSRYSVPQQLSVDPSYSHITRFFNIVPTFQSLSATTPAHHTYYQQDHIASRALRRPPPKLKQRPLHAIFVIDPSLIVYYVPHFISCSHKPMCTYIYIHSPQLYIFLFDHSRYLYHT